MAATTPDIELNEDADYGFSYEYGADIEIVPATGEAFWQPIRYSTNWAPSPSQITQPAQTNEDHGAPHDIVVSQSFTLGGHVQVRYVEGEVFPEVARLRELRDSKGKASVGRVRWYDKPYARKADPEDAYMGKATVALEVDNFGPGGEVRGYNITFTGVGEPVRIDNPFIEQEGES